MASKKKAAATIPSYTLQSAALGDQGIVTRGYMISSGWWDASTFLTSDHTGRLTVWGLEGQIELLLHTRSFDNALLGLPGALLVCLDGVMSLYRIEGGAFVQIGPVIAARYTPNTQVLVAGAVVVATLDGDLCVYRFDGEALVQQARWPGMGTPLVQLGASRMLANACTLSAGGDMLFAPHHDGAIVISLADGVRHEAPGVVAVCAWDRAAQRAVCIGREHQPGVYSLDCELVAEPPGRVFALSALWAGELLLSVESQQVRALTLAGEERWSLRTNANIARATLSPDGQHLALCFATRVLMLDAQTGASLGDALPEGNIAALRFIQQPPQLIAALSHTPHHNDRSAHRWSLPEGAYLGALGLAHATVAADRLYGSMAEAPPASGYQLARLEPDGSCAPIAPIDYVLRALEVVGEGEHVVSDSYLGGGKWSWTLRARSAADGWQPAIIADSKRVPTPFGLCAGAQRLFATTGGEPIRVFEAQTRAQLHALTGLGKHGVRAVFSADEAWLVGVGPKRVMCWSMADGALRWESKHLRRASDSYASPSPDEYICITPDQRLILTASHVHHRVTARSMETGEPVAELFVEDVEGISALGIGPDGRLYIAAMNGEVRAVTLPAHNAVFAPVFDPTTASSRS
jgi:hypothetical protein